MGAIVAILDPRFTDWGQQGYTIGGNEYEAAVFVQLGMELFTGKPVKQGYYVDIEPTTATVKFAICDRAPGPPIIK